MILSQTERRGTEDEGSNRQRSCVIAVNGCHPIIRALALRSLVEIRTGYMRCQWMS